MTSEDQVIKVDTNLDAIELFVTEKVQDEDGPPTVVGPAYLNNFEDFQGTELILIPTLAGVIAEGVILVNSDTSSSLQVNFDC